MARTGQRRQGARRAAPQKQQKQQQQRKQQPQQQQRRGRNQGDAVSSLAQAAREVEAAVRDGRVTPAVRTKFEAVALLLRDERARVLEGANGARRDEGLKRLDGIAAILAQTAVQEAGLMALLDEDADETDAARSLKRKMARDLGIKQAPEETAPAKAPAGETPSGQAPAHEPPSADAAGVVPQSVVSRQLASPFLAPDYSAAPRPAPRA
ncbi:MAG: hypothetical protein FWE35_17530, partial [Streptosporangiales bacterium]|nr:hypothetical protein [Streptosporangiales bacterium]